jgi:hypothetical protein
MSFSVGSKPAYNVNLLTNNKFNVLKNQPVALNQQLMQDTVTFCKNPVINGSENLDNFNKPTSNILTTAINKLLHNGYLAEPKALSESRKLEPIEKAIFLKDLTEIEKQGV